MPKSESKKRSGQTQPPKRNGLSATTKIIYTHLGEREKQMSTTYDNIDSIQLLVDQGLSLERKDAATFKRLVEVLEGLNSGKRFVIPADYKPEEYAKQTTRMRKYLQTQLRKREEDPQRNK